MAEPLTTTILLFLFVSLAESSDRRFFPVPPGRLQNHSIKNIESRSHATGKFDFPAMLPGKFCKKNLKKSENDAVIIAEVHFANCHAHKFEKEKGGLQMAVERKSPVLSMNCDMKLAMKSMEGMDEGETEYGVWFRFLRTTRKGR